MVGVYLKENAIILVGIQAGLEDGEYPGHINVFGVENIIQNGSQNFGKKTRRKKKEMQKRKESEK